MEEWHFGTAYELISDTVGDQPALICDGVTRTWREYDDRSARLAGFLVSEGLSTESKVGLYLHNSNEYMEAHHATGSRRRQSSRESMGIQPMGIQPIVTYILWTSSWTTVLLSTQRILLSYG